MANLPYDYARCGGDKIPACSDCMRTTPGRPDGWQVYISPEPQDDCPEYISPKEWNEPDR